MFAGRRDLQGALGRELTANLGQVGRGPGGARRSARVRDISDTRDRRQRRCASQGGADLVQVAGQLELRMSEQTRFKPIGEGQNQFPSGARACDQRRQQLGRLTELAPQR
jgi:hypothetical protein